jgi:2-keto-4-pentenoate hydratase
MAFNPEQTAQHLYDVHQARTRLEPIPPALFPATLDEAYAAQEALQARLVPERGEIVGWKIAITTAVMQELMGMSSPAAGAVFASRLHQSPVRIACADLVNAAVECEIGVRLGADLPGGARPYDRDSVGAAVEACMASIELIDDQGADYKATRAFDLVANNAWNGGVVLGPAVTDWRRLDLARLQGTMSIGGRMMGEGRGADVMGHPFNALAWLANHLATRGRPLRRGMVVSTGSIVSTKWPKPGERVVVALEGLGEAVADFF